MGHIEIAGSTGLALLMLMTLLWLLSLWLNDSSIVDSFQPDPHDHVALARLRRYHA